MGAGHIPYVDDAGRYADFHALRHSFITHLGRAGVHGGTIQELARHSTPMLTARYTHGFKGDEVAAVNALPDLSGPSRQTVQATGTDGDDADARLAHCLAQSRAKHDTSVDSNGRDAHRRSPSLSDGQDVQYASHKRFGGMAERLKAPVLKTGRRH